MPRDVPERNFMLTPDEPHMEVIDLSTRRVWQSRLPVTPAEYDAMDVEPPLTKIGYGRAAMDVHWFRRSPGAVEDGPLELRELAGREFAFCAMPTNLTPPEGIEPPVEPGGPRLLMVDKHHSLLFRAGRSVAFARLPDGQRLVHVIAAAEGSPPPKLPEGWTRETLVTETDRVIHLPCPTVVFFFPNGDSFQGPVDQT